MTVFNNLERFKQASLDIKPFWFILASRIGKDLVPSLLTISNTKVSAPENDISFTYLVIESNLVLSSLLNNPGVVGEATGSVTPSPEEFNIWILSWFIFILKWIVEISTKAPLLYLYSFESFLLKNSYPSFNCILSQYLRVSLQVQW